MLSRENEKLRREVVGLKQQLQIKNDRLARYRSHGQRLANVLVATKTRFNFWANSIIAANPTRQPQSRTIVLPAMTTNSPSYIIPSLHPRHQTPSTNAASTISPSLIMTSSADTRQATLHTRHSGLNHSTTEQGAVEHLVTGLDADVLAGSWSDLDWQG